MKIYSDVRTHETYCETWGASTKHPDTRHCYSHWGSAGAGLVEQGHPIDIIQWLLYVVSDLNCMPWNLSEYIEQIMTAYNEWMRYHDR